MTGTRSNVNHSATERVIEPRLIAGYVVIWLLEGAVRKWVPGTSLIAYAARDVYGLAVLALIVTTPRPSTRLPRLPPWVVVLYSTLVVVSLLDSILAITPAPVIVVGLRSYLGPSLLALAAWFSYDPRRTAGAISAVLLGSIPIEVVLSIVQALSPRTAFVNVQVNGDLSNFVNGGDVVRASGTFSAPLALGLYVGLILAFGLGRVSSTSRDFGGWLALIGAAIILGVAGSRGAILIAVVLIGAFVVRSVTQFRLDRLRPVVGVGVLATATYFALVTVLSTVFDSLLTRFNNASASEDTAGRLGMTIFGFLSAPVSVLGDGVGSHSNSGIAAGSGLDWLEIDGFRWGAELGVVGYLLAGMRLAVGIYFVCDALFRQWRGAELRCMWAALLAYTCIVGSVNETPTVEGAFSILLALWILEYRAGYVAPASSSSKATAAGTAR